MWPFDSARLAAAEREIIRLRAHIQDLIDLQLKEREAMIAERKDLLDRIMAITHPANLREARKMSPLVPADIAVSPPREPPRPAFSWPGFRRDTRPPDPKKEN